MRRLTRTTLVGAMALLLIIGALTASDATQGRAQAASRQFGAAAARTPTDIGEIKCQLLDPDGTQPAMVARCGIDILDASGEIMEDQTYDVRVVGSATVKLEAVQFLNAVRAQAEAEILPQ